MGGFCELSLEVAGTSSSHILLATSQNVVIRPQLTAGDDVKRGLAGYPGRKRMI